MAKPKIDNKPVSAEVLIARILKIMEKEILKIELVNTDEDLPEVKLKMLPHLLRIILATKVNEHEEAKEEQDTLALLSTDELMKMYEKEKTK